MDYLPLAVSLAFVLVFYLVALVKWQIVKRPPLFFLGALGLLFAFVGLFFTLGGGSGTMKVCRIFQIIGLLVAFAAGVLSCAGASVSMTDMLGAAKGAVKADE